jgi:hypothetical protein
VGVVEAIGIGKIGDRGGPPSFPVVDKSGVDAAPVPVPVGAGNPKPRPVGPWAPPCDKSPATTQTAGKRTSA